MVDRIVYCDGGAYPRCDGHPVPMIRYAAWCTADCRFEVREEHLDLSKVDLIKLSEISAIHLALEFSPCKIISDNKQIAKQIAERLSGGIPIEWVPRKKNRVADLLTHSPVGSGYLIFNSPQPERGWIDFIYD